MTDGLCVPESHRDLLDAPQGVLATNGANGLPQTADIPVRVRVTMMRESGQRGTSAKWHGKLGNEPVIVHSDGGTRR